MKVYLYLTPYTIINSKWIKDLHVKIKTIKLFEKNLGVNLQNIGLGNGLLDMTATIKKKLNWTSSKLKSGGGNREHMGMWSLGEKKQIYQTRAVDSHCRI